VVLPKPHPASVADGALLRPRELRCSFRPAGIKTAKPTRQSIANARAYQIEFLILIDDLSAHRTPSCQGDQSRLRGLWGTESGEMCELHFLEQSLILMETTKVINSDA
jgi:hypothetical protein